MLPALPRLFYQLEAIPLSNCTDETSTTLAEVATPIIPTPEQPQTVESYDGQSVSASVGDSIRAVPETTITVQCDASGFPRPTITWTKDGQPLSEGGRIAIFRNGSLSISSALASDSGEYSCIARNRLGENEVSSTIRVVGMYSAKIQFIRP